MQISTFLFGIAVACYLFFLIYDSHLEERAREEMERTRKI